MFNENEIEIDDGKREEQLNTEIHRMLNSNCCLDEIIIHFGITK